MRNLRYDRHQLINMEQRAFIFFFYINIYFIVELLESTCKGRGGGGGLRTYFIINTLLCRMN